MRHSEFPGGRCPLGIVEWLGELIHPGPLGSISFRKRRSFSRKRWVAILRFAVGGAALVIWVLYILTHEILSYPEVRNYLFVLTAAYIVLGYFVQPKPDTKNLGWFGGLINNPFRISDNLNRFLLWLYVILWPGYFVSTSIVDFYRLVAYAGLSGPASGDMKPTSHA
jgi:hypothetical protein